MSNPLKFDSQDYEAAFLFCHFLRKCKEQEELIENIRNKIIENETAFLKEKIPSKFKSEIEYFSHLINESSNEKFKKERSNEMEHFYNVGKINKTGIPESKRLKFYNTRKKYEDHKKIKDKLERMKITEKKKLVPIPLNTVMNYYNNCEKNKINCKGNKNEENMTAINPTIKNEGKRKDNFKGNYEFLVFGANELEYDTDDINLSKDHKEQPKSEILKRKEEPLLSKYQPYTPCIQKKILIDFPADCSKFTNKNFTANRFNNRKYQPIMKYKLDSDDEFSMETDSREVKIEKECNAVMGYVCAYCNDKFRTKVLLSEHVHEEHSYK